MNRIFVTSANIGCYGHLLHEQFKQRKQLFVDQLAWEIPHNSFIERDQYDRHDTCYVLIEENGALIGYARLLSTTSVVNYGTTCHTYMVKDAREGLLPGIPSDILEHGDPPVDEKVWEMTRFEARNRAAMRAIFETAADHLCRLGVHQTVSYTRCSYAPILNALGLPTRVLGRTVRSSDGKSYCVLETDLSVWKEVKNTRLRRSQRHPISASA